MNRLLIFILILGSILFLFSWFLCDMIYLNLINIWDELDIKYNIIRRNPFYISWHKLRWIFFASERSCWLILVYFFSPKYIKPTILCLLDFALGNFIDRVFFDYQTYSWNDVVIWIFVIGHVMKFYFPRQYFYIECVIDYLFINPVLSIFRFLKR